MHRYGRRMEDPEPDFKILFETAPSNFMVLAPEAGFPIVAVTDGYLRATLTERENILGRGLFEVFPDNPDDPAASGVANLRISLETVMASGKPDTMAVQKYDIPKPASEGGGFEERFWSPVNYPIFGPDGKILYITHRAEDVSEFIWLQERGQEQSKLTEELRTRTARIESEIYLRAQEIQTKNRELVRKERELQQSEALNRAVLETALDGITIMDESGLIQSFNPAAERIFGRKAEEVLGRSINMLLQAPYQKYIGVGGEVEGLRADGRPFPLHLAISEMQVGEQRLLAGLIRDISSEKKAQQELAEKNLELRAASRIDRISSRVMLVFSQRQDASSAQDVLDVLTEEAKYRPLALYLHNEWRGHLELAASVDLPAGHGTKAVRLGEGLVGGAAARREVVILDAPQDGNFALDTGIGLLQPATVFAVPLTHGEKLLGVLAGASPLRFGNRERSWIGQVAGCLAVGLQAQLQFQELKLLSEQLHERTRLIAEQNRELESANHLKSQFLATMSHELRTPLNAIIGFSEVLKDGLLGPLEEQQLDYVSEIFAAGGHLLSLINDILDLSKIEAGKLELELEPFRIEPLLNNAICLLKERAAKGGVELVKLVAPNLGDIIADARKLRQMIYNLLSNAVKFTPEGGTVRLEAREVDDTIEVVVEDTGIGIAAEDISRLFRPFEQLDGDIDRRYEGTGLGLALVKSLAELHGGTVGVESQPGSGSRFWLRIPCRRTAHKPAPEDGLKTALAVDPDPESLAIMRRWLENEGYRVEEASTVDLAFSAISRGAPDLILLDIVASQDNAWGLLNHLKNSQETADIPVVLTSVAAEHSKGMALGAFEVLEKPLSTAQLDNLLEILGATPAPDRIVEILVVDDDHRAVDHVAKRLEGSGYIVTRSYSGRDALALLGVKTYGLVILDLLMPDITGFEVLREMRLRPETASTPVVVLTAKTLDTNERLELSRSVTAVLAKSEWDEQDFIREVRCAVQNRRSKTSAPFSPAGPPGVLALERKDNLKR